MLKKETVLSGAKHPGTQLQIIGTSAGYYLGFRDKHGNPYTRETFYMTRTQACDLLMLFRGVIGNE